LILLVIFLFPNTLIVVLNVENGQMLFDLLAVELSYMLNGVSVGVSSELRQCAFDVAVVRCECHEGVVFVIVVVIVIVIVSPRGRGVVLLCG